jgi:hypothetical protein
MGTALASFRIRSSSALCSSRGRFLLGSAAFAAYLVIGSALMTRTSAGDYPADERLAHTESLETLSARQVEVELAVVNGPTLRCLTTPDRVAADTVAVAAAELPRLMGELGCLPRS